MPSNEVTITTISDNYQSSVMEFYNGNTIEKTSINGEIILEATPSRNIVSYPCMAVTKAIIHGSNLEFHGAIGTNGAFRDCSFLRELYLPECTTLTINSDGQPSFYYCPLEIFDAPKLKTLNDPYGFLGYAGYGWNPILEIDLSNVTFRNSSATPNTTLSAESHHYCRIKVLKLPKNITALGAKSFYGSTITELWVTGTTVPTASENSFKNATIGIIYVLPSMVGQFRVSGYWNNFNIQAIPE